MYLSESVDNELVEAVVVEDKKMNTRLSLAGQLAQRASHVFP